ncbi:MAG: M23 family metallopeptidase [Anaerolineales bacterium]|nr:M23 family metallopeptidase [Anaerolineales bacterium]
MHTSHSKLLTSFLIIGSLVTLSCSLANGVLDSFYAAPTPTPGSVNTPLPSPIPPTPTGLTPEEIATAQPTQLPTPTSTPSALPPTMEPIVQQPSITPTLGGAWLSGVTFHDYDADGLMGEGEPGVPDVWVCVYPPEGDRCALSGTDGQYLLEGLPPGQHSVYVNSPTEDPAWAFRYVNLFTGWREIIGSYVAENWVERQELPVTELKRIEDPQIVDIQPGTRLDFALTQGFLTDIFACGDRQRVQTYQAVDLDPQEGYVRNYNESESRTINGGETVLNGDNHFAIDWGNLNHYLIGTPLYAPANGIVIFAGIDRTSMGDCLVVNVAHPDTGTSSGVLHLEKVLVKEQQRVLRGQLLGTLGESCATWPHVHFFLRSSGIEVAGQWEGIDPYRDTANPDSFSYWTKDNDPQCPTFVK